MRYFKNAVIITGETVIPHGSFSVAHGRFIEVQDEAGYQGEDLQGCYVIPGFIDSHIHGFSCYNFEDPSCDYLSAAAELKKQGITSCLATLCPYDKNGMFHSQWSFPLSGIFKGVHLEGPFINPENRGGFYPKQVQPYSEAQLAQLLEAFGSYLRIITAAPEMVHWQSLCAFAKRQGIILSAGHTSCSGPLARQAFESGFSQLTHTFNAMPSLHHRTSGILLEALLNPKICCEAICDFYHVSPEMLMLLWKMKGSDKIIAVSDSVFVDKGLEIRNGLVYNGDIVYGSQSNLYEMFKNLLCLKVSILDAVKMTSVNAARQLGLSTGKICPGFDADFIVLDSNYRIQQVFTAEDFL